MSESIRLSDHFSYSKLLRFTLPSICMMVFTSIYGVVDGLFVSNFVGKTPFAAVNLVMPFVMILGGMGFMIGTGGTALVSKLLGEGKKDEAHSTFSMMVLFTLLLGLALSAVGVLMAVFKWGVAGAAIATGLSQCVGGVLPLIYFLRPNSSLLLLRPTALRLRPILQACGNGSSELMSNISSSLVGMLYNFQLLRLIGEDGVSAYGVLMYVQFIFVAIFIGYSIGCAPVVSFHYGAGNQNELKSLLRKSVLLMGLGGVALTAAAMLLASPLAKLFVGYDADLYALTTHAFRLFSWSFLLAGFNIFASGFFTALNNGAVSAIISFLRTLVFQAGSVIILPLLLDVDGIWYAITSAEIFAFIISCTFLLAKRNKYHYM